MTSGVTSSGEVISEVSLEVTGSRNLQWPVSAGHSTEEEERRLGTDAGGNVLKMESDSQIKQGHDQKLTF